MVWEVAILWKYGVYVATADPTWLLEGTAKVHNFAT